jgi:hypothetical protein
LNAGIHAFNEQIAYYLERFREGSDQAYHGLLETSYEILPELIARCRAEKDIGLRVFLMRIVWERCQDAVMPFVGDALSDLKAGREPAVTAARSIIPFLGDALCDPEPQVWKGALDGLVALASPALLEALRAARPCHFPRHREGQEFRRWLEEAIEQAGATWTT